MISSTVIITTRLKIRDAVAETAAGCLINDLGYQDVLQEIQRRTLWKINIAHETHQDPCEIAEQLATRTRLFVNPNKHLFRVNSLDTEINPIVQSGDDQYTVYLVIRDHDNAQGDSTLTSLKSLYKIDSVIDIQASELWIITIKADSHETAREIAMEIAVSRSQTQGLLANPHSQTVEFLQ